MTSPKPPKFTAAGLPDGRGQAEGSKNTRFASGDGRPRPGRPKGARDEKTIVNEVRDMKVEAVIGRRKRKIDTQRAILLKQREKALKGDQRAAEFMDRKFQTYGPPIVEPDHISSLLEEDRAILDAARRRGLLGPDDGEEGG